MAALRVAGGLALMAGVVLLAGCTGTKPGTHQAGKVASGAPPGTALSASTAASGVAAVPESALAGKVAMVSPNLRFVVLRFRVGHLPATDQRLQVYRGELRVGEVRVAGWQRDDYMVADVLAGDCQVGDEVWDR